MKPVISAMVCALGVRSKSEVPLQASVTRLARNFSTVTDAL